MSVVYNLPSLWYLGGTAQTDYDSGLKPQPFIASHKWMGHVGIWLILTRLIWSHLGSLIQLSPTGFIWAQLWAGWSRPDCTGRIPLCSMQSLFLQQVARLLLTAVTGVPKPSCEHSLPLDAQAGTNHCQFCHILWTKACHKASHTHGMREKSPSLDRRSHCER